jgi:pimeloyl-ACP methyl ester carboxylesterase
MTNKVSFFGGQEHWTNNGDAKLFLWEKPAKDGKGENGTILFVHGSSMASQPTFDLGVEGRPYSSAMNWFSDNGFNTWCFDARGYGRSDKRPGTRATISDGADDIAAVTDYIFKLRNTGPVFLYGISSGALRAAKFAERHPERCRAVVLDAFVWTGEGSPTLVERRKKLPNFRDGERRPIDQAFMRSVFERDHPDTADNATIQAYADAVLSLDDSMPNGTYIDMCTNLPVVDPLKINVPALVLRGEHDGIASLNDLLQFFEKLPNPDKQFTVMPGISHASFQQKNYMSVYHIMKGFFTRPEPVYRG